MKLHANVFGEGTPLVILHGFLGMGDNWKTLAKKISEHGYQMHLIDQRNHGRSPHSDEFNYEILALDLLEYCKDRELNKIVLLGHSMGGKTAMLFAATYPDIIDKLIVADIGPKYYPLHHQDILDGLGSLDFEVLKSRGEVDKALELYVREVGVRMFLMKNLFWKEKGQLGLRINLESLIHNSSEIGVALPEKYIYSGDTLFLRGEKSNYIIEDDIVDIKRQFPQSKIKEISNSGHWLHAENPSEFLMTLLEFLKN
ncbi:Pimeloyl-ACP methyl ester carboxylesterase [Aquimarina amphilecti]|uniref:Pimeloyl-ACP methyl ester carboxylesterase n=1 Tax=Aquimarina amphilecti TaxID=1038014 RepID=A0A1H7N3W5_AQUAM|nr:alpha/beta fold hydrolase [Aquimarina amphilecti]SEL18326.1 Pimeloyl-ACP methyl ester carboxylesterase [Aquimarina amphilecti]